MDTDRLVERAALHDLVATYAHRVDQRDADGVAALFIENGTLGGVDRGAEPDAARIRNGRTSIAAAITALDRWEVTTHFLGQHLIDIDGDDATGELYCLAHHVGIGENGRSNYVMSIRYLDEYTRRYGSWQFASRTLHVDWTETRSMAAR
jgi:hypothetical protein